MDYILVTLVALFSNGTDLDTSRFKTLEDCEKVGKATYQLAEEAAPNAFMTLWRCVPVARD